MDMHKNWNLTLCTGRRVHGISIRPGVLVGALCGLLLILVMMSAAIIGLYLAAVNVCDNDEPLETNDHSDRPQPLSQPRSMPAPPNSSPKSASSAISLPSPALVAISNAEQRMLEKIPNGCPLSKCRLFTSRFGQRMHPMLGKLRGHEGVDIGVAVGTPVRAPADGVVENVDTQSRGGYGQRIIVRHAFGFSSVYAHLSRISVKPGDELRRGVLLGYSGNSGLSSGPHLHYEVRYHKRALDAVHFINWSAETFYSLIQQERDIPWNTLDVRNQQQGAVAGSVSSLRARL